MLLFPNFAFMEYDLVVTEVIELNSVSLYYSIVGIAWLLENAKGQDENREFQIDGIHSMIATLIDKNDVISKI